MLLIINDLSCTHSPLIDSVHNNNNICIKRTLNEEREERERGGEREREGERGEREREGGRERGRERRGEGGSNTNGSKAKSERKMKDIIYKTKLKELCNIIHKIQTLLERRTHHVQTNFTKS